MGWEQAINSTVSQPISATNFLSFSTDRKKNEALVKSYDLKQGIYESVEDYNKRMAEFRAQLAKKIREENTTTAEKKYNDILGLYLAQTKDPSKMEQGLGQLKSLFRFANFNNLDNTFDEKLYLAKQQLALTENRLSKIKNGQEDDSRSTSNPMLYSGEFQNLGERDFLS